MIISRNSVTVSLQRDIESYYRFYKLQASTASVPVKPMNNATIPPSGWSKTEPAYTEGSTNSLYFVDLTNYSDGTFEYSDVSLSSSYEAAKQAYNKAVSAGETANTANANAESKNAVFYQTEAPPTTRRKLYDVWYDTDDGAKMYYWDGAAWTAKQFGGNALGDNCIAARHIVAHSITTNEITAENLVGSNGWINLAQGTFNYGDALIWDGSRLTVNGVVDTDALTATGGTIGGWLISDTRLMSANASIGSGGACLFLINESGKPFIAAQNEDSAVTFQLARNGKLTATDATITGAITATSLTAKNTYYIHNANGAKKVAMTAPDASFGSSLDIGTGFTAVHINGRVITGMELIVGEDLTGSIQCGAIITNVGIRTYGNVNRIPIGSDNPDKFRVAQIASYTSSINIWAQWGVEGASYTARSLSVPSSDIRLKDNVANSEIDALSVINQIQMRQFDWKDRQEHWDVGFVADELERIDPLLSIGGGTDEDGNPMYKSVNDFYLLGYLTKAVQELSEENARLKKRVSHLEAA